MCDDDANKSGPKKNFLSLEGAPILGTESFQNGTLLRTQLKLFASKIRKNFTIIRGEEGS